MAYSKQFSAICPFFQTVKFSIFPSLKNLLLFSFYNFVLKKVMISCQISSWKKRISAWSASSISKSVTSLPSFSSSSCSSTPCVNGTVLSHFPWIIKNGGASLVTKLTGQHASASLGLRIAFFPISNDSGDAAHCSSFSYRKPLKSVGGYHGHAACTLLE